MKKKENRMSKQLEKTGMNTFKTKRVLELTGTSSCATPHTLRKTGQVFTSGSPFVYTLLVV